MVLIQICETMISTVLGTICRLSDDLLSRLISQTDVIIAGVLIFLNDRAVVRRMNWVKKLPSPLSKALALGEHTFAG